MMSMPSASQSFKERIAAALTNEAASTYRAVVRNSRMRRCRISSMSRRPWQLAQGKTPLLLSAKRAAADEERSRSALTSMQVNPCGASRPRLALRSSGAVSAAGRQRAWRTAGQTSSAQSRMRRAWMARRSTVSTFAATTASCACPKVCACGARSPTASARQGSAPRDHSRRTSAAANRAHGVLSVSARLASTQRHWRDSERRVDNSAAQRYEMDLTARAPLSLPPLAGVVTLVHARSPQTYPAMPRVRAYARSARTCAHAGLKVVPRCPFIASYIEAHPEFQDLLADPR